MTLTNQERAWRHQFALVQEGLEQDRALDKESNIYSAQDMRDAFSHGWQAAKADQPAPTETEGCEHCGAGPHDPCDRGVNHADTRLAEALASPPGPRHAKLVEAAKPVAAADDYGYCGACCKLACVCSTPAAEAEPRFRVGQRVKRAARITGEGEIIRLVSNDRGFINWVRWDDGGECNYQDQELEPADPAPPRPGGERLLGSEHIVDGFLAELGCTVRDCLGCGCLVAGGPTRCKRCANEPSPAQPQPKGTK